MEVICSADRPDLTQEAGRVLGAGWPEFIFHDDTAATYAPRAEEYFPRYRLLVLVDGQVAAGGWGVPLAWDGTTSDLPDGYDGALVRAVSGYEAGTPATTLSVMAAAVGVDRTGARLSTVVLESLIDLATADGLAQVVAPLRPTLKHHYPTVPLERYARWVRDDGLSVDPWIRVHQRMGAEILAVAPRSMVITASVREWETWTGRVFPTSGPYVIPEALNLLQIDREADVGRYEEENLWVQHR